MHVLRVDIYESKPYPIVSHEFRGKTQAECMAYFRAHLRTDTFLAGCVNRGSWRSVQCRAVTTWYREAS